jgi:hypothetical protein
MGNLATSAVARLTLKTSNASANSQGFIANQVVTQGYIQANSSNAHQYDFCLREIDMSSAGKLSDVSTAELLSIIDSSGCDLALMPLIKFNCGKNNPSNSPSSAAAIGIVKKLQALLLPIDITVWFDDTDFKTAFPLLENRNQLVDALVSAGYSVGYYGGEACECSPSNSAILNGSIMLNVVSCGSSSVPSKTFPTVKIGDNSNACKIRWLSPQ